METKLGPYSSRYLAGDTRSVWNEIGRLDSSGLAPEVRADVSMVCCEALRRFGLNVANIVSALESLGYQFGLYPDGTPYSLFDAPVAPPDPSVDRKLAALAESVGEPPLILSVLWRQIGSVCLIGAHPDWPDYSDPLVIDPIDAALEEAQIWHQMVGEAGPDEAGPFRIPIAPDKYHKDNVSGGDWYGIELPCPTVDAHLSSEPHNATFVEYLRIAVRAKGFPGAEQLPAALTDLDIGLVDF